MFLLAHQRDATVYFVVMELILSRMISECSSKFIRSFWNAVLRTCKSKRCPPLATIMATHLSILMYIQNRTEVSYYVNRSPYHWDKWAWFYWKESQRNPGNYQLVNNLNQFVNKLCYSQTPLELMKTWENTQDKPIWVHRDCELSQTRKTCVNKE